MVKMSIATCARYGIKSIILKEQNNDVEVDNYWETIFTVSLENVQSTHQCRLDIVKYCNLVKSIK